MKTHTIVLIAGSLFAVSLAAAPASANEQFGNDVRADTQASVQVAGYYDRARAYIRRATRRRNVSNGQSGVRG